MSISQNSGNIHICFFSIYMVFFIDCRKIDIIQVGIINDVTYYWYRFWFVHGVDYTFNYLGHAVCAVPPRLIDQLS
jgi:hypothetical protein